MSVTILEALQNAECNINGNGGILAIMQCGKRQLHNAVTLLVKGYSLYDEIDPLLTKYDPIETAPEKDD